MKNNASDKVSRVALIILTQNFWGGPKCPFGKKVRFRRDLGSANTKIQEPGAENPKINIQEPKYF